MRRLTRKHACRLTEYKAHAPGSLDQHGRTDAANVRHIARGEKDRHLGRDRLGRGRLARPIQSVGGDGVKHGLRRARVGGAQRDRRAGGAWILVREFGLEVDLRAVVISKNTRQERMSDSDGIRKYDCAAEFPNSTRKTTRRNARASDSACEYAKYLPCLQAAAAVFEHSHLK